MKKTILVHTDFSLNSLNTVKVFFEQYAQKSEKYEIVFLTGYELSNSITELLFISKSKIVQSIANQEFFEAFNIIKNKFESQLHSTRIEIFTGFGQTSFNDLMKLNNVSQIFTCNGLTFNRKFNKNCFDLTKLIKKSGYDFIEIETQKENEVNYYLQSNLSRVFEGTPQLH